MKYHGLLLVCSWILYLFARRTKYELVACIIFGIIVGFIRQNSIFTITRRKALTFISGI